jgi:branched-chain amino acid transport system substrate-binding protein
MVNKKISRFQLLALTVAMVFLFGGPGWSQDKQGDIKIGFIGPLTGAAASYGIAQMHAISLAVGEVNTGGGINGKKLEVIFEDSQMDPNKSISAMKKLVDIDKVPVVIGETSTTATLAIADIAEQTKTVLFSPLASGAKVTDAGDYVFRCSPSDAFQAVVAAKFVFDEGLKDGAIVYTNDDWGSELQKAFLKDFVDLGGTIMKADGVTPGTQNFRSVLVKIKSLKPDFIYIPLHNAEATIFLRQVKELRVPCRIIGADSFGDKSILKAARSTAEGVMFTMPTQPTGEKFQAFTEKFRAKFNDEATYYSAAAYDSLNVLAEAIRMSAPSGEQIKNALYKIKEYKGASGVIGFDKNGDVNTKEFSIIQIKNGEFVPYKMP